MRKKIIRPSAAYKKWIARIFFSKPCVDKGWCGHLTKIVNSPFNYLETELRKTKEKTEKEMKKVLEDSTRKFQELKKAYEQVYLISF